MKRDTKLFTKNQLECYAHFKILLSRFGYTEDEITGPSRVRKLCEMRQRVAMALYQTRRYSTTEVGLIMKRDHSSILNMINPYLANRKREMYLQKTKDKVTRRNPRGRRT